MPITNFLVHFSHPILYSQAEEVTLQFISSYLKCISMFFLVNTFNATKALAMSVILHFYLYFLSMDKNEG